jgi:hypothetical protein
LLAARGVNLLPSCKIVLKEIYDDFYYKKTVSRGIRRLSRYFTPYSSSVSFAPYLLPALYFVAYSSSVTLLHAQQICVIT